MNLKALSENSKYDQVGGPDASLLEAFPSPFDSRLKEAMVEITCPEFTSLCPMTGQPDFATIVIRYVPGDKCVESKALKLYLMSFRNHGEFHEACVNRIAMSLINLLQPKKLYVQGQFTPRGGIPFWPKVNYEAPEVDSYDTCTECQTIGKRACSEHGSILHESV